MLGKTEQDQAKALLEQVKPRGKNKSAPKANTCPLPSPQEKGIHQAGENKGSLYVRNRKMT